MPINILFDNLLVRFSKTCLNLVRHLKLTQSLNIGLNWDTNQLRRTRSHSNGIGHQLSTRLYPFPQSRRSAQSPRPHFDSCLRSLWRLDYCLPNRSGWDPIGRRNTADQCCSPGRPQCPPCTPVSMWGYCPIRRSSSNFMPFQCWSISSTLCNQQHHAKIT